MAARTRGSHREGQTCTMLTYNGHILWELNIVGVDGGFITLAFLSTCWLVIYTLLRLSVIYTINLQETVTPTLTPLFGEYVRASLSKRFCTGHVDGIRQIGKTHGDVGERI